MLVYLLYSFLGEKFLKKYLIFISRFVEQKKRAGIQPSCKLGDNFINTYFVLLMQKRLT